MSQYLLPPKAMACGNDVSRSDIAPRRYSASFCNNDYLCYVTNVNIIIMMMRRGTYPSLPVKTICYAIISFQIIFDVLIKITSNNVLGTSLKMTLKLHNLN